MKHRSSLVVVLFVLFHSWPCHAGFFDDLSKKLGLSAPTTAPDEATIVNGLKEALSIGTQNAVKAVGRPDGYFGNEMIKILMPERMRQMADLLGKMGLQGQVDEFVVSMNRAAEKAAPEARGFFVAALKEMTFDDAQGILKGGNTAASEYFKRKTHDDLYNAFKPIVNSSMNEVGVTRSYEEMVGKIESIPFMKVESLDLNKYVTGKALDGLSYMLGEEEKKIRTDPAAQVTDLLKTVFGK